MYSRLNAEVATQSIDFPDLLHPSMSAAMATVDTVRTMTGIGTDILTTVGPSTENIPLRGVDFATLRSRSQVSNTRDLYLNDACIDAWGALVTDNEVCVFSSLVVSHLFDGRGPHVIPQSLMWYVGSVGWHAGASICSRAGLGCSRCVKISIGVLGLSPLNHAQ